MLESLLKTLKIQSLNPMQLQTIEAARSKKDIVLLSPTGSGKTLAFLLPITLDLKKEQQGVQVMIIVPTRELALQIEQVFRNMSTGIKVLTCYGGHSFSIERKSLTPAPTVLIGTPGRVADHLRRETFNPESIQTLVLDEFDKSLEMGFKDEMGFIIEQLTSLNKRYLTSATNLEAIPAFVGLTDPTTINFIKDDVPVRLKQKYVVADGKDKVDTLFKLLCKIGNKSSLVFCNHREAVDRISDVLHKSKIPHSIFHGGLDQEEREKALIGLRNGSIKILLTTDLASRGLDIPEIEFVIHYQLPPNEQTFIHRNGRTARMHAGGTSYLVLSSDEYLPPWLGDKPEKDDLNGQYKLPPKPEWTTIYIAAGKKDKVNKVDVVGLLMQKGNLQKNELGLIEVKDHACYVAVKAGKVNALLESIRNEKIKNKKVRIGIAS
jgi:ATP-dependent RNA helicase DbpA